MLDNNLKSKFADDAKISNSVFRDEGRLSRQKDLHKISTWSVRWEFNREKCQAHQDGTKNKKYDYEMCDAKLESVQRAKDRGVKITSNFCPAALP